MGNVPFYKSSDYDPAYDLLIYGYGFNAISVISRLLDSGIKIRAIFDNDQKYHGRTIEGIPILPVEELENFDRDLNVLISPTFYKFTLRNMLRNMGFHKFWFGWKPEIDYIDYLVENRFENQRIIKESENAIASARAIFSEPKSLEIFDACLHGYTSGDWSPLERTATNGQYFPEELFTCRSDEVFIDCGAYDGKTATSFARMMNGQYKRIISFEPSEIYCELTNRWFELLGIHDAQCYRYAVCDTVGSVSFDLTNVSGQAGRIDEQSETRVPSTTLDEFFKSNPVTPTFVKMDIEGAETSALMGAAHTIKADLPKLAICCYHKMAHLWEVPNILRSFDVDYDYYFRHHASIYDTVLYALPRK